MRLTPADMVRFWSKVDRSGGPDACWPWTGARAKGYGQFSLGRQRVTAHRVAWMLVQGPIPEGQDVLHRCDHPPCCNMVKCGFLGTQADNMADKMAKGRQVTPRGERNGSATLTADQVRAIRARYAAGGVSQRMLAREIGIDQSTISKIVRRETWTTERRESDAPPAAGMGADRVALADALIDVEDV